MSASVSSGPISIKEYLRNPEYEHAEYIDGWVAPLNVGTKDHGRIQVRCGRKLDEWLERHGGGYVAAQLHCRLTIDGSTRFRLPDLSVVLADEDPQQRYLNRAPDLAVEIRSPEDSLTELIRKADEYFANGSKLVWIVLPEEESVLVRTADGRLRPVTRDETLEGGDPLPGLTIAVADLFK